MTFFAKDGLAFTRDEDGNVEIRYYSESIVLDGDTWASLVAAMSAEGNTAAGFETARSFHFQGLKRVRLEPPTAI